MQGKKEETVVRKEKETKYNVFYICSKVTSDLRIFFLKRSNGSSKCEEIVAEKDWRAFVDVRSNSSLDVNDD